MAHATITQKGRDGYVLAIQYRKSPLRYLLVRLFGKRIPQLCAGWWAPTSLVELSEPHLPAGDWVKVHPRLAGICGSDIDVIAARGSFYFAPLTSYPFILGHEVVGDVVEVGNAVTKVNVGDRVVLEPALSCPVRGITPPCEYCQRGQFGNCERIADGSISPGVQTGYCRDTGGAWSELLVAHEHQLHHVPDGLPDEIAILTEPFACALHAALRIKFTPSDKILLIGCGTMGLMTLKALRMLGFDGHITAVAKYQHQRDWAHRMGASVVVK
ncbi:MAG TPA: zinc-binding alcohol dehydrogenase, partial [Armatimonadetes bacterium]|nr:zinc-binding alcohol dehydrogenase [Armatimonadota bacterium]